MEQEEIIDTFGTYQRSHGNLWFSILIDWLLVRSAVRQYLTALTKCSRLVTPPLVKQLCYILAHENLCYSKDYRVQTQLSDWNYCILSHTERENLNLHR